MTRPWDAARIAEVRELGWGRRVGWGDSTEGLDGLGQLLATRLSEADQKAVIGALDELPEALDEIERLRAQVASLEDEVDALNQRIGSLT